MSHLLHRLKLTFLAAVICCLAFNPRSTLGQFLFLDTNGDARSSPDDVLNPVGEPTTVNVYLDTSRNPDSSVAYCSTGSEALSLVSYEFILHAVGGTVTFGNYTNARSTMGVSFGTGSNSTDFYRGFGGGTILPPGLYQLGTLVVTVETGSPTLNPSGSTVLSPHFGTSFGTQCLGTDGDNTYKLGLDWYGIAGCGPPGGLGAPASAVAAQVNLEVERPVCLVGEFSSFGTGDSLSVEVRGLPPGLFAVGGWQTGRSKQTRIYGRLDGAMTPGTTYDIEWSVTDGSRTEISHTALIVQAATADGNDLFHRVEDIVTASYFHGLPKEEVRDLGTAALPHLARMLRDRSYKGHWIKVARAIGILADTAYLDTLRAFVWDRFSGTIDRTTFMAIRSAQGSLSEIATASRRALDYLIATASAPAWARTPWVVDGYSREQVASLMRDDTLVALAYTDAQGASDFIRELPIAADERRFFLTGVHKVHERVRINGYVREWQDQAARSNAK
jgi:hypothetical protein